MVEADWARELLFADIVLGLEAAAARDVAAALERFQESEPGQRRPIAEALVAVGALTQEQQERAREEVEHLVRAADGDPARALARRGGIDRAIYSSLAPRTAAALRAGGTAARAPLRIVDSERYQDFTLVSQGGMGVVYLALDTELNRRVAFKMVRPDPAASREQAPDTPLTAAPPSREFAADARQSFDALKLRFLQEAWITGAMEHPGIVPVYELGKTGEDIPYYTMRYVKGERTLATAIKESQDLDERLALLEPFLKVCDAVRYAHARGVLHRDLKPENVALGTFGEAVVLDWGLSKATGDADEADLSWQARLDEYRDATDLQTVAGALGTPGYMAPEAAVGRSEEVDARSDVYSLGAILYEILTRQLVFRFTTFVEYVQQAMDASPRPAHEVADGVPRELSDICARALARVKEERFASVDDLARAVRRWQTEGRLQQQIDGLIESARAAVEAARQLSGNMMLWHLDRATAACTRVLHLKQDQPDAFALRTEIKSLREQGIRGRVSAGRWKLAGAAAVLVLALGVIGALVVAQALKQQREEAEARIETGNRALSAKERELREARRARGEALDGQAGLYASVSVTRLAQGDVAGARLVAARALTVAPAPAAWRALAAAEAAWAPTLHTVLGDLAPGPVALSPDGSRLYVCAPGGKVREFDLATRQYGREYDLAGTVGLLVLSPDGKLLAAMTSKGAARVWATTTGALVRKLEGVTTSAGTSPVTAAAFAHDNASLFTGHTTGVTVGWRLDDGNATGSFLFGDGVPITALCPGPDGTMFFVGNEQGWFGRHHLGVLDEAESLESGEGGRVVHVAPTPDGDAIHACTANHRIFTFDLEDHSLFTMFRGPEHDLAFALPSHDHGRLYVADAAGVVSVWSVADARALARLDRFRATVTGLALSADETRLAVAYGDTAYVWALDGKRRAGGAEPTTALAQGPDRKRTWLARPDHSIELWDGERGATLARWTAHSAPITALASDGERVYSASLDGTLMVWPAGGGEPLASFKGPAAPTAFALGPDDTLLTGAIDGTVEIWSWPRKRRVAKLPDAGDRPVIALRAGPRILAWDDAGNCRAWDAGTHAPTDGGNEAVPGPADLGDPPPPLVGEAVDWIRKDATLRLIDLENRSGLKLAGAAVVAVPRDEYRPDAPRMHPWSR